MKDQHGLSVTGAGATYGTRRARQQQISGIKLPDSQIAPEATELVREHEYPSSCNTLYGRGGEGDQLRFAPTQWRPLTDYDHPHHRPDKDRRRDMPHN